MCKVYLFQESIIYVNQPTEIHSLYPMHSQPILNLFDTYAKETENDLTENVLTENVLTENVLSQRMSSHRESTFTEKALLLRISSNRECPQTGNVLTQRIFSQKMSSQRMSSQRMSSHRECPHSESPHSECLHRENVLSHFGNVMTVPIYALDCTFEKDFIFNSSCIQLINHDMFSSWIMWCRFCLYLTRIIAKTQSHTASLQM